MNYEVLTTVHGLRRAGEGRSRPIAAGEVIALPDTAAGAMAEALERVEAIAPTDRAPTVELDLVPVRPLQRIEPDGPADLAALSEAARALGATLLLPGAKAEGVALLLDNDDLLRELKARIDDGRLTESEAVEIARVLDASDGADRNEADRNDSAAQDAPRAEPQAPEAQAPEAQAGKAPAARTAAGARKRRAVAEAAGAGSDQSGSGQ